MKYFVLVWAFLGYAPIAVFTPDGVPREYPSVLACNNEAVQLMNKYPRAACVTEEELLAGHRILTDIDYQTADRAETISGYQGTVLYYRLTQPRGGHRQ